MPWFFYDWLPDPKATEVPSPAGDLKVGEAYLQEAPRHLDPAVAVEALIQQIERDGARQQTPHDPAMREALGLDARP
jgi:hypothetical protein